MESNNLFKVLLYYKYNPISNPEKFASEHRTFCKEHNLVGRIIISAEGINGTCSGTPENILAYMDYVNSLLGFEDVWFKEHDVGFLPFQKLKINVKNELVILREKNLDVSKGGKYLKPEEFHALLEKSFADDSIVFFDARNKIESKIGKFRNAIAPDIKFFRELPDVLKKYENLKDKKIMMYCTGGIRCENASALLLREGFKEVYQLEGGIYNYMRKFPNGYFDGTCFVFDDRMQIIYDEKGNAVYGDKIPDEKIISSCDFCGRKASRVVNDERGNERTLVVCCEDCDRDMDLSRVRRKSI